MLGRLILAIASLSTLLVLPLPIEGLTDEARNQNILVFAAIWVAVIIPLSIVWGTLFKRRRAKRILSLG